MNRRDTLPDNPDKPKPASTVPPQPAGGDPSAAGKGETANRPVSPLLWVSTTNFCEGLTLMIVRVLSTVYFTDIGAKERYIGYLNFLGIPWNLKFLWAPFVDLVGTKRSWIVVLQLLVAASIAAIAGLNAIVPAAGDASPYLLIAAGLLVLTAFFSASGDIAIDGFYMEGLTSSRDQAAYSGYRVLAYRLAVVFVRSGLVAVAAYAGYLLGGTNLYRPWFYAFGGGALTMLLLAIYHAVRLPRFETARKEPGGVARTAGSFVRSFRSYLRMDRIAVILPFIILYKMGDEMIFSMVTPFLMRELGLTKAQYSWIAGIVGAGGAVAGAMLGAWWIKSKGLKKAIWPLTLLMNLNIWAYIWLAGAKPDPATNWGIAAIAIVHGYEQVAAGLGSAALTIFMMSICQPEFKATHYAISSAVMSVVSTVLGGFGGRIVESMGYLNLFILGFFCTLPSMVLLFWVPIREEAPR